MEKSLRIAIAGLGTVGVGVIKLLQENAVLHASRTGGCAVQVVAVSARSKDKDRGINLSAYAWEDDPVALASREDVDVVVELMGGDEGDARELVETALATGKDVVTANKALIAKHGLALAALAEKHDTQLAFEAAVAGGIPILGALRHGLAANAIERLSGILNGSCNYILTTMEQQGRDFDEVLAEAQELGYAEADPALDVDGIDAAHKLAILTSFAYGCAPNMEAIYCEGIRTVSADDMEYAKELGYAIRLLGIAEPTKAGILQRVHPCMIPREAPLGEVDGVFNAVQVQGDAVGRVFIEGQGAGAGPTASSVVADILDIARGIHYQPFTVYASDLEERDIATMDEVHGSYYLRLSVVDEPGVLQQVTGMLAQEDISIKSFVQREHTDDSPAQIALMTHDCPEPAMQKVITALNAASFAQAPVQMIRVAG